MSEPVRAHAMRLSAEATRNPLSESWWLALAKNGSSAQASRRLLWLGFEVHYLANLIVCRIGRIQPNHPALSTFNIGKESPMSRATTVAEFVELNARRRNSALSETSTLRRFPRRLG
jgi:hypothetical protein